MPRIIYTVCCLAGAASFVDDAHDNLANEGVLGAIEAHNTGAVRLDGACVQLSRASPTPSPPTTTAMPGWVIHGRAISAPVPNNVYYFNSSGQNAGRLDCPLCARSRYSGAITRRRDNISKRK